MFVENLSYVFNMLWVGNIGRKEETVEKERMIEF